MKKMKQRIRSPFPPTRLPSPKIGRGFIFFPFLLFPRDQNESYVLSYRANERRTCVVLKQGAEERQVLKGTFQVGPATEWKMVLSPMQKNPKKPNTPKKPESPKKKPKNPNGQKPTYEIPSFSSFL